MIAFRLERAPRWAWVRSPPAIIIGAWVFLCAAVLLASGRAGEQATLCLLRRTTGTPCPTCGATRAGLALARMDVAGAIALNPLMTVIYLWVGAWLLTRTVLARRVVVLAPPRARWCLFIAAVLLMGLNWIYILRTQG